MQAHNQPARHFKQLCDFINIQYLPKPLHIDIKSLICYSLCHHRGKKNMCTVRTWQSLTCV